MAEYIREILSGGAIPLYYWKKVAFNHTDLGLHLLLSGWTGEFACLLGCVIS